MISILKNGGQVWMENHQFLQNCHISAAATLEILVIFELMYFLLVSIHNA